MSKLTVQEIFKEIDKLQSEPIAADELSRVKQYLLGEFIRDFDGPFAQAQAFRAVNDFGLDHGFYERYEAVLKNITAGDLQHLAQKYLQKSELYTVIAGQ